MGKNDIAGRFKDVVYRDPIFPDGFQADITTIVFGEPNRKPAKVENLCRL
jgi:hypothetical protein